MCQKVIRSVDITENNSIKSQKTFKNSDKIVNMKPEALKKKKKREQRKADCLKGKSFKLFSFHKLNESLTGLEL